MITKGILAYWNDEKVYFAVTGWISPELIDGGMPTPSSDVYAFGITLFEVR